MKYEKSIKSFLFLALIWTWGIAGAQNKANGGNYNVIENEKFYKVISFGDKIDFGNIEATARWTITNSKGGAHVSLNGKEINKYSFDEPGEYEIHFYETKKHDDECNHPMFPGKMMIKVNPVKLSFDFSKIKFSEKLEKGKMYTNLIITVPAKILLKDNSITTLSAPDLSISGIGVSLLAEAQNKEVALNNGTQLFRYKISGLISKEAYLMFDFYDFNNQAQTYNLSQIIN